MQDTPLYSIVINNYNYGRFLGDAIETSLKQTYPAVEVIVVDDGSTDDSRQVIECYRDRVIPVFKENGGQASAFNAGFAVSQGEFLVFLDADDMVIPVRAAREVQAFQAYPEAAWLYHDLQLTDVEGNPLPDDAVGDRAPQRYYTKIREFDLRADIQSGFLDGRCPKKLPGTGGCTFRRSHLAQILPMPEADGIAMNDSYIQFASCALSPGIVLPTPLVFQRIHGKNAYTLRTDVKRLKARINVMTAYWLKVYFPGISAFTNKLFGMGLGYYWGTGRNMESDSQQLITKYLSELNWADRLSVFGRALYHSVKP